MCRLLVLFVVVNLLTGVSCRRAIDANREPLQERFQGEVVDVRPQTDAKFVKIKINFPAHSLNTVAQFKFSASVPGKPKDYQPDFSVGQTVEFYAVRASICDGMIANGDVLDPFLVVPGKNP